MKVWDRSIRVLVKIGGFEAIHKQEKIIEASYGVMIARVDLVVEIPLQEKITQVCGQLNNQVFVAFNYLNT
ncbi:putative pyruvate kinase [Rosa chinensis]|uniref:Putative pyruvate kinase n=1 Tax=Rosa chinensis TaxID=74649 RepID=A0A2P6SE83_ROSCH|nr:putative pyruvate kinase [Rosa chinensis]